MKDNCVLSLNNQFNVSIIEVALIISFLKLRLKVWPTSFTTNAFNL